MLIHPIDLCIDNPINAGCHMDKRKQPASSQTIFTDSTFSLAQSFCQRRRDMPACLAFVLQDFVPENIYAYFMRLGHLLLYI